MSSPGASLPSSRLYGLSPCPAPPLETEKCRCGTPLGRGTPCFHFSRVPGTVKDLLASQKFCGLPCARAFLLEALELVDSREASSVLRDLEEIRVGLRYILRVLAG